MANQKKDSLSTLFSEEVHGPFVTFLFNTHVAHQNVEKDSLVFEKLQSRQNNALKKFLRKNGLFSKKKLTHF